MICKLLVLSSLALHGCSYPDGPGDCAVERAVPSFASAELPVIGGGEDPAEQLWIEVSSEERTTVNGKLLGSAAELRDEAKEAALRNPDLRAFISADEGVTYGALMVVVDMLKQVGISRMAFGLRPGAAR
jgi:biopolymer transport protein ExbD